MLIRLTEENEQFLDPVTRAYIKEKHGYEEFPIASITHLQPDKFVKLLTSLSVELTVEFVLDMASTTLPYYEKEFPQDALPRKAISTCNAYLDDSGTLTQKELLTLYNDIRVIIFVMRKINTPAYMAINSICYAVGAVYAGNEYKYSFIANGIECATRIPEAYAQQTEVIKRHFNESDTL